MIILFDLDGVLLDTESQYTSHWNMMGEKYFQDPNFGITIKGQTLVQILGRYVNDPELAAYLEEAVDKFENEMEYDFIPGALDFLKAVKEAGIPSAIVTSSANKKMEQVYARHPEIKELVDVILTAEHFTKSKPDPECFLKGMEVLGGTPETTVIFEDSMHGIAAGRGSGAHLVGLATTNSREVLTQLCDLVIDDFNDITIEQLKQTFDINN